VDINVTGYAITGYDFIDNLNYCDDANWWNASRDLPCPGTDGDKKGFVIAFDSPKLEDGKSYGKGLLTYPEKRSDGYISGKFEAVKIQSGDRFQALIGCEYKANDCDVIFRLQYQIGSGTIRTLGQWREAYEGQYYPVNIDLSTLAGEKVKFILTVFSNGAWDEDHALWINPRITRQSSTPATSTPTPTPTATATSTSPLVPTVTTQAVTNITTTTATGNGAITALGVPNPTEHGIVWNTSTNPTIANSKTTNGPVNATGTFTGLMAGLTPGTQYYVRAYATNATGTVYGTEVTFITYQAPTVTTQAVTNIATTSAMGNGTITALGVPNPTEYGIVWGTSADPIITGNKVTGSPLSATNTFTGSITGLTPGAQYHVRAYATNATGTVYGADVVFTAQQLPSVTTSPVTTFTSTTATFSGTITVLGVPNPTEHGFVWSTTANPTTTTADDITTNGAVTAAVPFTFDDSITGLTPATLYHVRAYVNNAAGTVYGEDVTFTTGP
jgi:hypothetical protein